MISIVDARSSDSLLPHLETYRQWVSREWDSELSFEALDGSPPVPAPLLAMLGGQLVGGVSFTWHVAPGSADTALWINTVYVDPSNRDKGVASALVVAAEEAARKTTDENTLLVYTDVPDLYTGNDWTPIDQDGDMWILHKKL